MRVDLGDLFALTGIRVLDASIQVGGVRRVDLVRVVMLSRLVMRQFMLAANEVNDRAKDVRRSTWLRSLYRGVRVLVWFGLYFRLVSSKLFMSLGRFYVQVSVFTVAVVARRGIFRVNVVDVFLVDDQGWCQVNLRCFSVRVEATVRQAVVILG